MGCDAKGLIFERTGDGSVHVTVRATDAPDAAVVREATLDPLTWAGVVAAVACAQDVDLAREVAGALHSGDLGAPFGADGPADPARVDEGRCQFVLDQGVAKTPELQRVLDPDAQRCLRDEGHEGEHKFLGDGSNTAAAVEEENEEAGKILDGE